MDESEALSCYEKIDIIQAANFGRKFVFVVRCRTSKNIFILKEITCPEVKQSICNFTVEPSVLQQIHAPLPTPFPGIIKPPQCFCGPVRVSLVFEMMSMDLFTGLDKFANANSREGVTEDIALIWLAQMIMSVAHLQSRRVIHRDLKPENIFLDHNGNCVIGDFGLSETGSNNTNWSDWSNPCPIVGAPLYIPPEVFSGPMRESRSHLIKSDMWALGVIGYELLSSSNPWNIVDVGNTPFPSICGTVLETHPVKSAVMSDGYFSLIKSLLTPDPSKRLSPPDALAHPVFDPIRHKMSVDALFPTGESDPHDELKSFVKHTINPNSLYTQYNAPVKGPVAPDRRMYGTPHSPGIDPNSNSKRRREGD